MAGVSFVRWKTCSLLVRLQAGLYSRSFRQLSTKGLDLDQGTEMEEEWAEEAEENRLQELRNVSGLPPKLHQQLEGVMVEPPFRDLRRRRKLYAAYGSKSGEDPRLLWPSRQDLARMRQEDIEEDIPLQEKIRLMQLDKDAALKSKLDRHKSIEKNMSLMSKWIKEYHNKVEANQAEIQKKKDKKEALLDEARDYFGYRIKANDPKFQQMVEEKEERERKEAREAKKKEKARKLAERLKQDALAMKMSSAGDSSKDNAS